MASQHAISHANSLIEIEEFDQAHNLIATYIQSPTNSGLGDDKKGSRIDVVIPENTYSYARSVLNAFLPAGYPNSVTSDYLEYQIYDSLQAFSSSIAGLLSSRAVLEGLGVGNASASPTSALLLSVLQDSMGRIATIAFAHRLGSALEPECKMYRLLADVFNDAAMVLDCLSPAFPKGVRVGVLAGSSVLRSLCGVAAGSSKASLSAHFAKEGNLGELNAKDSSQETIISLLGMLFGTLVVSHLTTKLSTWIALLFLLAVHLGTNYKAVTAVCMRSLNRQRACLVLSEVVTLVKAEAAEGLAEEEKRTAVIDQTKWPTPEWVRMRERVFERDGIVRTTAGSKHDVNSWCEIGISLRTLIAAMSPNTTQLLPLLGVFKNEKFILWFDIRRDTYLIVLKEGAESRDVVKAWFCVVVAVRGHGKSKKQSRSDDTEEHGDMVERLDKVRGIVDDMWEAVQRGLEGVGWDLDVAALETRSGCRVRIKQVDE